MEGTTGKTSGGYSLHDRAIGAAVALFSFFLGTKICLLIWNLVVKRHDPLADIPPDGVLYLVGGDLLVCLLFAVLWWLLQRLEVLSFSRVQLPVRMLRWLFYATIVMFCVVSFQVARIYGEPLDIELLRSGDNLMVLRQSIWAYVGPMPVALIAYGLLVAPLLGKWTASRLSRRHWLRTPQQLWAVVIAVCIGGAVMQRARLHRIDTFGVKDNALVFFAKEYRPAFKPIDSPQLIAKMEAKVGRALNCNQSPPSLVVAGGKVQRDFDYSAEPGRDLNVIVIQMESTSAIHVDRETAPNITALAEAGLSFQRHTTVATQTRPASCGLYYSDYLPELGTTPSLVYGRPMPQPALAEILKRAGYHTGVFQSGFLDYLEIRYLFQDKGVDTLIGAREMVEKGATLAYSSGVREEQTVDELTSWIKAQNGAKFFATYLTEAPHHPYVSMAEKKPFGEDSWLDRYRNSLHYADESVGRLIAFLKAENLFDKTLIVVVGDHGETVSAYPVGHGLRVSAEEMRTPFILANSKLFPKPQTSTLSTDHLDVAPTIVQLLGLSAPKEWLGRNLLSSSIPAVQQFVSITHIHKTCIVDNGLLFLHDADPAKSRLYDFSSGDMQPLAGDDARVKFAAAYQKQSEWFAEWSVWRHLKRADAISSRDVAHHNAEDLSPRTAADVTEPTAAVPKN